MERLQLRARAQAAARGVAAAVPVRSLRRLRQERAPLARGSGAARAPRAEGAVRRRRARLLHPRPRRELPRVSDEEGRQAGARAAAPEFPARAVGAGSARLPRAAAALLERGPDRVRRPRRGAAGLGARAARTAGAAAGAAAAVPPHTARLVPR